MTKTRSAVLVVIVLLLAGIGSGAAKSDEEAVRELDAQWSKAAQNKDAAKFATFYAETGSALPFNAPIATGRAKVQELWTSLMAKPGFALNFDPTSIVF